jgi:phosphonoacetate hydrolase
MASERTAAIIVVLDGLRPDMVTSDVMPTLCAFRARATTFANARSVFPSVTAVAAASMATGQLPATHGVLGSELYWESIARDRVLDLRDHRVVRGLDQAVDGHLVDAETFGDVLARAGQQLAIVDAGVPVASTLLNPRAARHHHWTFSTTDRRATPTPQAWDEVVAQLGFPPERDLPRFEEVRFATDVMVRIVLAGERLPEVAVLWLSEPDTTSRYREIGSTATESALRHVDRQLARVLAAIDERQGLDETLVIVASDHGQITAEGAVDVAAQMQLAQLPVGVRERIDGAGLVLTGGGYGALTLTSSADRSLGERAARWLMEQPWVGHVLTAGGDGVEGAVPGTLSLGLCGLAHARAPTVMFTFSSHDGLDRHGMVGRGLHGTGVAGGGGTHGGLNAMEMSTVLMIAGPGFAPDHICTAAAGILDIAPTILARLGLSASRTLAGRDLSRIQSASRRTVRVEAATGRFRQSVLMVEANGPAAAGHRLEMDARNLA